MKSTRMTHRTSFSDRGFTILEVVVAMIIISILTLIMMPTVTNRSNQARVTAAERDMQALAEAESRASIDMGYYVAPWRLNNVIGGGEQGTQGTPPGGHANPNSMFIDIVTLDIPGNVSQLYTNFTNDETSFGWRGPYVNFRRDDNDNNWPDDPWGNDYILFTKAGGLFPPNADVNDGEFVGTGPNFIPTGGGAAVNVSGLGAVFDRPTWISMGPNGLPGTGEGAATVPTDGAFYGNGDDIAVLFEGFDGS